LPGSVAPVADEVPAVVGQLDDADPTFLEQRDGIELFAQRFGALESEDEAPGAARGARARSAPGSKINTCFASRAAVRRR
jgi:hypothetical protein